MTDIIDDTLPTPPKRKKTGGRKPGIPNKSNKASHEVHLASVARLTKKFEDGVLTPLEFLVDVYTNKELDMSDRIPAARTAGEYIHTKLARAVEISGPDESAIQFQLLSNDAHRLLTETLFEDGEEQSDPED